ncbi:cation diffusion facilitator family transporter [Mycobacterium malmoense]|uniref:cation diffusion facilitator family transporter n=1 Tax=Mycobacterium malmoense TaxID=1780 RepID=UPI00080B3F3A|nr:cation diffusion facilitator family transporter [Mycobacterium malmoense]OCB18078.1 cation diffusion facilitator family transporter [Mycobacterium malmoense]OCB38015.1 cation diffusion facilitator family transporter [Mycobacterium malmoense]OCB41349.1 cation diffusion facilitator family transporter [Mycobacterium malmoense]
MAADGTTKSVVVAFAANAGIAVAKFVGFLVTGSSAMLAESVHSLADTINEVLLLVGKRKALKPPDALHQFGYGRSRYFYSFVVALLVFVLGAVAAMYEGYRKISHPEPLTAPGVAIAILVVAALLEGYSLHTVRRESKRLKGSDSWWEFVRNSRTPEPPVVLLEDSAALLGLGLAFAGVTLTAATKNSLWDAISTLGIGVLLAVIAVVLIVETHSLLIGEGATTDQSEMIRSTLRRAEHVDSVVDLRTQYLAPDQMLVAARIVLGPDEKFATAAGVIRNAEARIREALPAVRVVYIQPEVEPTPN